MRCRIFGYACVHQSHTLKLSLLALELDSVSVVAPPVWAAISLTVLSSTSPIPCANEGMLKVSATEAARVRMLACGQRQVLIQLGCSTTLARAKEVSRQGGGVRGAA